MHRLPAPKGDEKAPLKALLVDSWYDAYLGVVVLLRKPESPRDLVQQILGLNQPGGPLRQTAVPDGQPDQRQALRTYGVGAQILADLGVRKMRVLSAPKKMRSPSAAPVR